MTTRDFSNHLIHLCLNLENRIATVVDLQARWEVWLQVELAIALEEAGYAVDLEKPYYSQTKKRLDIMAASRGHSFAIELKVESAIRTGQFAGQSMFRSGGSDIFKLQDLGRWPAVPDENQLCMMVGYSDESLSVLRELAVDQPPSFFEEGDFVGVAVYQSYYY